MRRFVQNVRLANLALGAIILCCQTSAAATLTLWHHGGRGDGGGGEMKALYEQVASWNEMNPSAKVEVVALDNAYDDKIIQAAALEGKWPDILDFDGPAFANAAWLGQLEPLDGLISQERLDSLLPSIRAQGTYAPDGKMYVLGQFDSGLGIWAARSALNKAGVRIPSGVDDAWTGKEFNDALEKLKRAGYETPLDLKLNYGEGEWFTYGFSAILQSFGGDLINRETWQADGTLNSPASVGAMDMFQSWIKKGYIVPASAGDDAFYGKKSAAMALVGHWMMKTHSEALGDDLVLVPMPKFGERHVTGMGSWNWGIWSGSSNKEAAGKFLEFIMSDANLKQMAEASGAVPASQKAANDMPVFRQGGIMALYPKQLNSIAVPRPAHPAYPVITASFARAVKDIIDGENPQTALDRAAANIDQEIDMTDGYAPFSQ